MHLLGVRAPALAPDERERLGLRLAVVEQGPNAPWVVAALSLAGGLEAASYSEAEITRVHQEVKVLT